MKKETIEDIRTRANHSAKDVLEAIHRTMGRLLWHTEIKDGCEQCRNTNTVLSEFAKTLEHIVDRL